MSGISAAAGVSAAGVGGRQDLDPSFFEHLLNDVELVTLDEAAKKMDKVQFFHGGHQAQRTFEYEQVRELLRGCVVWAKSKGQAQGQELYDARVALQAAMGEVLGMEGIAAIRFWTCSPVCYAFNSVMRSPGRSRESVDPVLAYGKLLFAALHALPARFLFQGTLFRGETCVMHTWQEKKERLDRNEDVRHFFYVPTSFSVKMERAADFKAAAVATGADRTFFTLNGAAGYYLKEFSSYACEEEVLVEPLCCCTVVSMEIPQEQFPGETLRGLHTMELRVRPGISLLCVDGWDGPAKQAEKKCYEDWQSERDKLDAHQAELDKCCEKLDYAPVTKEEWESKGHQVPKKDPEKKMAKLGQGGFMTAYRMRNAAGELFAVKMVKNEEMSFQGITRADVEREARTLQQLKHKHVIRCLRMYEDEDEEVLGLVMEWAQGGSLAELMKARAERGQNVGMAELLDMSIQMAKALDYVHGEGILHRDVKAENVLLASAEGGAVCIKLADLGVVFTHTAGTKSHTAGRGTEKYYSPEKARSKAYGTKADMWAVGCIIIELACCDLLTGALWSVDDLEVQDRRKKYFATVHQRDPVLGDIAKSLLDRDATSRLSASELRVCLDKLKKRLEQHEEAGEEERARARARALQEAEDARVARALQAEEEERMSAAAAEKQRQEEEKAAKAAAAQQKRKEEERVDAAGAAAAAQAAAEEARRAAAEASAAVARLTTLETQADATALISAMLARPEQEPVQQTACQALANLARSDDGMRVKFAAAGGIVAVVAAMKTHNTCALLQQQACLALHSLALNNSDNEGKVAAAGGIEAIISAMQAHKTSALVQEQACAALASLAFNPDGKVAAAAAGGIEAVLAAMQAHKTSAGVQQYACLALINLAANPDNQVAVAAAGGIEAVLGAMQAHMTSAGVQEQACGALVNLANNPDVKVAVAAAGGIEALATAMKTHQASALLQQNACLALINLAFNASLRGRIKAAGGVELAKRAVSASGATAHTKDWGKRLLLDLLALGRERKGSCVAFE